LVISIAQSIDLPKIPRCLQPCKSGDHPVQKLYALRSNGSDIYTFIATAFCVLSQKLIKKTLVGKHLGKQLFEYLGVAGRVILKWFFSKYNVLEIKYFIIQLMRKYIIRRYN
jgi:hypothetical protein